MPAHGLRSRRIHGKSYRKMGRSVTWLAGHFHAIGSWQCTGIEETGDCFRRCDERRAFLTGNGEIEIAPVDTQIIACAVKDSLITRSDAQNLEVRNLGPSPGYVFICRVHGHSGIHVQQDSYGMRTPVRRAYKPGK